MKVVNMYKPTYDELCQALKECVEATEMDLDGNNDWWGWLCVHGAGHIRDVVKERDELDVMKGDK